MPNIKCKTLENNNPDNLMKLAFLCIKTILRFRKLLVDYLFMFFLYPCRIKDQSYFFALHFRLWLFIALWLCTQTAHWMSPCLFGTLGTKYFWKKKKKTDFSEFFLKTFYFCSFLTDYQKKVYQATNWSSYQIQQVVDESYEIICLILDMKSNVTIFRTSVV